jgi:hypothetical protein
MQSNSLTVTGFLGQVTLNRGIQALFDASGVSRHFSIGSLTIGKGLTAISNKLCHPRKKPKGAVRLPWQLSPPLRGVTDIRCRSREYK